MKQDRYTGQIPRSASMRKQRRYRLVDPTFVRSKGHHFGCGDKNRVDLIIARMSKIRKPRILLHRKS